MRRHVLLVSFIGAITGGFVIPACSDELEDALDAFDEIKTTVITTDDSAIPSESPYGEVTGNIAVSASYNFRDHDAINPDTGGTTDWQGLSKLRSKLYLEYNKSLSEHWQARISGYGFYDSVYSMRDRDNYSNAVLSDYEHEAEFQEVWIRGKLRDNLDIKIGRQIVNWGRADSFRVLDILNPLDNREPGLVDIEDLRLPVTMAKMDYFFDEHWSSSLIIIPEVRFSKNPAPGNDFYVAGSQDYKENKPEDISDSSFAASVSGIFSGWDVSFHTARYWRDTPYLKPVFNPAGNVLDSRYPLEQSTFEHSRLTMVGASGNFTQGGWLYKSEVAFLDGVDYTLHRDQGIPFGVVPTTTTEKNRLDALLGIEYFGIANTSMSVEVAHQYIPDYEAGMKPSNEEKNTTGLSLRATHNMLNDRLDLTAVIFGNFGESGGGWRLDAEYDIRDALVLSGGVIFFEKGDHIPFDTYYQNDRVFSELKYSF